MLSKEDTKKRLEEVIISKAYKEATDVMEVLDAIYIFLLDLKTKVVIRAEYNATHVYYEGVHDFFKDVFDKYNKGDIFSALSLLHDKLVDGSTGKLKLNRDFIEKGTPLFRMRSQGEYKLLSRKEMFHIATDKIKFAKNYRYSLNGFPCLYLGASLYVCWEEMRRADIDHVNYVKFVSTRTIPLISTLCPNRFKNEDDVIQFFIFALCTKMANNDNDKFQFQYAFPELLLHLLTNCMQNREDAWGIKYVSARYFENDGQFSSEPIFYNYVIPKRDPVDSDDHLSIELKKSFKVSDVKAFYVKRIFEQMPKKRLTRPNEYANTHFKLLEDELKARKYL